jgi:hypothetical protein
MKRLESRATSRKNTAGYMAPSPSARSLAVLLAAIGCCATMPASADDDRHPADVTITVVEDPEQLKEKINKIPLPDADKDSRAAQKGGNQRESQKSSSGTGGQQRNETAERHRDSGGSQQKENAERQHDAGSEQRDQATEGHHDTSDKPPSPPKADKVAEDETRHREPKLPR